MFWNLLRFHSLWQLKCTQLVIEIEQSRLYEDLAYANISRSKRKEVWRDGGNQVKKTILLSPTVGIKILVYLKK